MLINNYKKIISILYVYIFIFWTFNIHLVNISKYFPDSLYYIRNLSIFYWLGIILIITVFILDIYIEKKSTIKTWELNHFLLVIFAVFYLYGTPSFIYSNARALDVYAYTYLVDNIVGTQIIHTDPMYFTQFKGSTLMFSMIFQCTKINSLIFAKYYPIYLMALTSIFIYETTKKICTKYYILSPLAYLSLGWVQEYHLSPQSHVLILSIILFYLLTLFVNQNSNVWQVVLLIFVTWSAICNSHALTPILIIFSLIFTCGSIKFLEKINNNNNGLNRTISPKTTEIYKFLGPFIIIYIASAYSSSIVSGKTSYIFAQILYNLRNGNTPKIVDRAISFPSPSYLLGYDLRLTVALLTIITGFICLLIIYSLKRNTYSNIYIGGTYLGFLIFGMILILGGNNDYGFDRAYLLLLIPYSIMCSMLLDANIYINKQFTKITLYSKISIVVILFFILSLMVLLPITRYASDPYDFLSESDRAGKNFCFKFNNNLADDPANQIRPISPKYAFYASFYNYIEMKAQRGSKYINKINSLNIIYDSGQFKTSQVYTTYPKNNF